MRKLIFILLFSAILIFSLLIAQSLSSDDQNLDRRAFNTANSLYMRGKYDEAIQIYENLAAENQSNSSLYFNLGNAYYMKSDIGRALVNYKRALRINPRDPDIRKNIQILQAENTGLGKEPDTLRGPIYSLAMVTNSILSINEIVIILLGLWFLIFAMILLFRISKNQKIRIGASASLFICIILFIIAGFSTGSRILLEKNNPPAVVTALEITLNSQPDDAYKTDYSLKNGAEVLLTGIQGEWVQLSTTSNTMSGWVPATSVERIANSTLPFGL